MHFRPDVLARLMPQDFPYPPRLPPNWPTEARADAVQDELPIQLLCLPTYASWLNPAEKLWRKLYQELLHLHRYSADWEALKRAVGDFLTQFQGGSPALLRYIGLLPGQFVKDHQVGGVPSHT